MRARHAVRNTNSRDIQKMSARKTRVATKTALAIIEIPFRRARSACGTNKEGQRGEPLCRKKDGVSRHSLQRRRSRESPACGHAEREPRRRGGSGLLRRNDG